MSVIGRCEFAKVIIEILTKKENPRDTKIATYNEYCKKRFDVIFPVDIKRWRGYVNDKEISSDIKTIIDYFCKNYNLTQSSDTSAIDFMKKMIKSSIFQNYNSNLDFELGVDNNILWLKLDRNSIALTVIKRVIEQCSKFGNETFNFIFEKQICLMVEKDEESEITTTRLNMIKKVSENLLNTQGFIVSQTNSNQNYTLTTKSTSKNENDKFKKYLCGVVLNSSKKKEKKLTKDKYLSIIIEKINKINAERHNDVAFNNENHENNVNKIANACITYEMLSLKPNVPATLHTFDELDKSIKNATFVLYNNARISSILKKYKKLVQNDEYPNIVSINEISKLEHIIDDESWDLIYNYIMKYPDMLRSTISIVTKNHKQQLEFHIHNLWAFVISLCHKFSSYYRRYRVLMSNVSVSGKSLVITSERLHLLRALNIIITNVLSLLNVEDVHSM